MKLFLGRSCQNLNGSIVMNDTAFLLILWLFVYYGLPLQPSYAEENNPQSAAKNDAAVQGIVNPFDSDCYDWRGKNIPCDFNRSYAELLYYKSNPDKRFSDNKDGTVTDNLTKLVWIKSMNCFGLLDWQSAIQAVQNLKAGDCGPNRRLVLADGSSPGDWRLPTMKELCTLIDFGQRDPALPAGHMFADPPPGYHWSATTLEYHPELAWIVYFESGTTCYENINNQSGYILPVRSRK